MHACIKELKASGMFNNEQGEYFRNFREISTALLRPDLPVTTSGLMRKLTQLTMTNMKVGR